MWQQTVQRISELIFAFVTQHTTIWQVLTALQYGNLIIVFMNFWNMNGRKRDSVLDTAIHKKITPFGLPYPLSNLTIFTIYIWYFKFLITLSLFIYNSDYFSLSWFIHYTFLNLHMWYRCSHLCLHSFYAVVVAVSIKKRLQLNVTKCKKYVAQRKSKN